MVLSKLSLLLVSPCVCLPDVHTCVDVQGCAQEVISGGKFPRGIKRRGQPCACVRRT